MLSRGSLRIFLAFHASFVSGNLRWLLININTYLVSEVLNSLEIRTVVPSWAWSLFLVPVPDFGFQVRVCLFERSHFLQVGGQAIVQALHGRLFISRQEPIAPIAKAAAEAASTIATPQAASQARGDKPGGGHGHTSATGSPVDAGGPEAAPEAEGGGAGSPHHGGAGLPEAVTGHGEEEQGPDLSCTSAIRDPEAGECPAPPPHRFYAGDNGSCLQNVLSETHGIYQP